MNTLLFFLPLFVFVFLQANQQSTATYPKGGSPPSVATDNESSLLEIGQGSKLRAVKERPTEIKMISYNIRWRGGEELRKLIQLFKDDQEIGDAAVLALQEVDRNKKRTKNVNTVKQLADELGCYYAWAAPPVGQTGEEEETGVALLSIYPASDVKRIVLPHEGPNRRRRVALGATLTIGRTTIRVYSVHGETRIPVKKKLEQMSAVINDVQRYSLQTPAVIMGDFNTWEPSAGSGIIKLFNDSSFKTPFGKHVTFSRRVLFVPIQLHLDWIWLRGLEPIKHGIDNKITISDHFPLWITIKLSSGKD